MLKGSPPRQELQLLLVLVLHSRAAMSRRPLFCGIVIDDGYEVEHGLDAMADDSSGQASEQMQDALMPEAGPDARELGVAELAVPESFPDSDEDHHMLEDPSIFHGPEPCVGNS